MKNLSESYIEDIENTHEMSTREKINTVFTWVSCFFRKHSEDTYSLNPNATILVTSQHFSIVPLIFIYDLISKERDILWPGETIKNIAFKNPISSTNSEIQIKKDSEKNKIYVLQDGENACVLSIDSIESVTNEKNTNPSQDKLKCRYTEDALIETPHGSDWVKTFSSSIPTHIDKNKIHPIAATIEHAGFQAGSFFMNPANSDIIQEQCNIAPYDPNIFNKMFASIGIEYIHPDFHALYQKEEVQTFVSWVKGRMRKEGGMLILPTSLYQGDTCLIQLKLTLI